MVEMELDRPGSRSLDDGDVVLPGGHGMACPAEAELGLTGGVIAGLLGMSSFCSTASAEGIINGTALFKTEF